jgi:hypothetical protein
MEDIAGGGVGIKEMTRQPHLCRITGRGKIGFRAQRKRMSATRGDVSASRGWSCLHEGYTSFDIVIKDHIAILLGLE